MHLQHIRYHLVQAVLPFVLPIFGKIDNNNNNNNNNHINSIDLASLHVIICNNP